MRGLKFSALFAAIVLSGPVALAADAVRPYTPPPAGGWYFRADVGYKWYGTPDAIFNGGAAYGPGYAVPGNGELFNETMGSVWAAGGGIGYDTAGALRLDVTLDYEWPSHFYGRLDCPTCVITTGYSEETADISAWTGLFNVYWDFGHAHHNLMPYVGAGLGFSYLTTTNVFTSEPAGPYPGASKWNVAWALMAGVTKDVTPGMKLDINYRYLSLGEAISGTIFDAELDPGNFQYQNIHAHEIRIGLRHMF